MPLSSLILTFNEAPNVGRCLERLAWAREILVIDSFSTDATVEICKRFPNVRVLQRAFDSHANQWNFGREQAAHDWVLALDADYIIPGDTAREIQNLNPAPGMDAYFARFIYCVNGRPLRACLYPPRAVLFNKKTCTYIRDGHTQLLKTAGGANATGWLKSRILHDDRKSMGRWLSNQADYAALEATKLTSASSSELRMQDRLRKMIVIAPFLVFFYTLVGRGLILDGWPGWYYVFQRTIAEILLSLKLIEHRCLKR